MTRRRRTHGQRSRATNSSVWSRLSGAVRSAGYSSAPYRILISGRAPTAVTAAPADLRPGDATAGTALLDGQYAFCGQQLDVSNDADSISPAPWGHETYGETWLASLHGFTWLRDLRAVATDASRTRARALVTQWLKRHSAINDLPWRADVLGRRTHAWLGSAEFLLNGAEAEFRDRFFVGLALQVRHLARTVRQGPDGAPRFSAIKGLVAAATSLPDGERRLQTAMRALEAEIGRQVFADGGHVERSPSAHLTALADLIDIRACLTNGSHSVPDALQQAIDRMAPMLRAYRHGDGALALFNDSTEETSWLIDLVLAQADARGRAHANAPHAGFRRIQAGRSLALLDVGAPSRIGRSTHAGTLSFEFSVGKERMIVNCGAWRGGDDSWKLALRATAAHSTLTINDKNSSKLLPDGTIGAGPDEVDVTREDQDGAVWIDARHDGFVDTFGLIHRRRIYIAADGSDVRGEDLLQRQGQGTTVGREFAVRFHLHPDVQVSMVQDGSSALIRLPSGAGWQMRAKGGTLDLAESVYAGQPGERRRASQIIVTGAVETGETLVNWALRKIPKN